MNDRKKNRERQAVIAGLLEEKERMSVNGLSEILDVSRETIRRDLKEMEGAGIVQRVHGGAVLTETSRGVKEYPFLTRKIRNYKEKVRLCRKAAEFIEDGDVLFVDNSSTMLSLVSCIPAEYRVTIITNSIQLLLEAILENRPYLSMISVGGFLRNRNYSLSGTITVDQLRQFRPNKVFLSCHGISVTDGVTDGSLYEVDAKKEMLSLAKERYLLADSSKFGKSGVVLLSRFDSIDYLITDAAVSDEYRRYIEPYGTKIVTLEENGFR